MQHCKELIGMPVVVSDSHVEIEHIEGFVLDPTETQITALVVDSDDWSRQARVLSLRDIHAFGTTEITVDSSSVIHSVDQVPDIRRMMNREVPSVGTVMVTCDGIEVGTVEDLSFDEETGGIESFQVGRRSNTQSKSQPISLYDELDDELIVHLSEVIEQKREVQRRPNKVVENDEFELQRSDDDGMGWAVQSSWISTEPTTEPNDLLPVNAPLLPAVLNAIWKGTIKGLAETIQQAAQVITEHRILRSVGCCVHCTFVGRDNKVIVRKGEIISWEIIDRARAEGILHELLRSVSRQNPDTAMNLNHKHFCGCMDDWCPPYI